jgi:hypothetical protein
MKFLSLIALFFSLLNPVDSFAKLNDKDCGGCGGHGGDTIAQEFYQIALRLYQGLEKVPEEKIIAVGGEFRLPMLKKALEVTRISTSEAPLFINGVEVDAINSMDNSGAKIVVSRKRWLEYQSDFFDVNKKQSLVLHEYLGVVKALYSQSGEWDEYSLSTKLIGLLDRYIKMVLFDSEFKSKAALAEFDQSASKPVRSNIEKGLNYSCAEYSLLNLWLAPRVHINVFSSASLGSVNFVTLKEEVQTGTRVQSEMRMNSRGDLFVKISDADTKIGMSISHCSQLGSKAVQMAQFLADSLIPIFDMPTTNSFEEYQLKIKKVSESRAYERCVQKATVQSCLRTYHALDRIKLDAEHEAVVNAKSSVGIVNQWLATLSDLEKQQVAGPIFKLYDQYVVHQSYLASLLELGDFTFGPMKEHIDLGLKSFVDTLLNRLPQAYAREKEKFLVESLQAQEKLVESFSI